MNQRRSSPLQSNSVTAHGQPPTDEDQPQLDSATQLSPLLQRAMVLHGGGSAGNAWEIGVIAGLFENGVDLTIADLIIGTSAGATVAAQITSAATPAELLSNILTAGSQSRTGPAGPEQRRTPSGPSVDYMEISSKIIAGASNPAEMRRNMGAAALAMDAASDGAEQTRWRETVAGRLPSNDWPERRILITAVNARTGEPVVFDRHSEVELVDAVAASCANGFGVPPYRIGDVDYIDGGYRRNENADLAGGYERVLVLSPFGGRTRHPLEWGMQLAAQVDELRAGGSKVETIFPNEESLDAFGANMMDPLTRPPAAQAGYDQGRALAEQLKEFWC